MSYTIVGVVGHIDHGKTSLVAALTGINTDTHPEEKRRGITIDLGFASFTKDDCQFALIDAPGHQRYVGNLLAGVSCVEIGLLVVACDQGIQEQTLEHAAILRMLGVHRLIVALSRSDLATVDSRIELQEELELYLEDAGFQDIPMIPVSSVQRVGLDELQTELCRAARAIEARPSGRFFRMPVDRVFSMPGRGCVIAGTVWSGIVRPEDSLQLADSGTLIRVRGIEIHGKAAESSAAGYRTALNVTGISVRDIRRGDELIQPEVFQRVSRFLVEVETLKSSPEIKCPATLQLHLATNACAARMIGVRYVLPGKTAVVVVETEHPVIVTFGQRCLFRLPYPVGTIAGGRVLGAMDDSSGRTRRMIELGERLAISDPAGRLAAWIDFLGEADPQPEWCELQVGIPRVADLSAAIQELVESGAVSKHPNSTRLFSTRAVARIGNQVIEILTKHAVESRNAWRADESIVEQLRNFGSGELIRWVLQSLIERGIIVRLNNMLAIASDENRLSAKQKARMNQIAQYYGGNRTPPTIERVATELDIPLESVISLCRFGVQSGILTDVGNGLLLEPSVFRGFCDELLDLFVRKPEISVAEIRDRWQVTRKHAVPFLEYCDRMKITTRLENSRIAGPALSQFASRSPEISSRPGQDS